MEDSPFTFVEIHKLRKGMFIQLELGWMDHPFPVGSFKIVSDEQLQTLRALGVGRVRYYPGRSDPVAPDVTDRSESPPPPAAAAPASAGGGAMPASADGPPASLWQAQQDSLGLCERRFRRATEQFDSVSAQALADPESARRVGESLVSGCLDELLANGESVIRLLSEATGERSATHAVNVLVVCLLLGKALDMNRDQLTALGMAAVMHDLGKLEMAEKVRHLEDHFSLSEVRQYQAHVEHSVGLGRRMRLPANVLEGIAHHHELVDGTGFPLRLSGERISRTGRVLALVNAYDNLCNPPRSATALTPHEALSTIFAQLKNRFDPLALGAFIRLMGVYPPGSVVQLINDRFALVVSVNSARPLRPKVIVHDARVPREEATVLDLEDMPELGIRRSLKPLQLPKAALDYLSPRQRICYFFERALTPATPVLAGGAVR